MSEYRSDLRAARERIEQLEAQIAEVAEAAQKKKTDSEANSNQLSVARIIGLVVVVLPLVTLTILVPLFIIYLSHPLEEVRAPTVAAATTAPPKREGLGWHELGYPHATGPWPVKLHDQDASSEMIIGLAIDRAPLAANLDQALFAVAIERESWRTLWRSGPFPSMVTPDVNELQHLVVKDDRVVVTDAVGGVHILDAKTGEQLFFHKMVHGGSACLDEDTHNVALTVEARFWSQPSLPRDLNGMLPTDINRNQTLFLDTKTGKTRHAPQLPLCPERKYCSKHRTDNCSDLDERARTPASILASHEETWRAGTTRISLGRTPATVALGAMPQEEGLRYAVGWDASTRTVKWQKLISELKDDPRHPKPALAALDDGRFVYLSQHTTGGISGGPGLLRLLALGAVFGETRFDIVIPHTGIGTRVHSLTMDRNDIFVVLDDELFVFDATTGVLRRRLESL